MAVWLTCEIFRCDYEEGTTTIYGHNYNTSIIRMYCGSLQRAINSQCSVRSSTSLLGNRSKLNPRTPRPSGSVNIFLPASNAKRNKSVIFVLRVPHFSVLHFPSRIFSRGHVIWFWLISVEHSSWSHNTSCCATEYKKLNCGRDSAPRSEKWTHWARLLSLTACNYKI